MPTKEELKEMIESKEISLEFALKMCFDEIEFQKSRFRFYKEQI